MRRRLRTRTTRRGPALCAGCANTRPLEQHELEAAGRSYWNGEGEQQQQRAPARVPPRGARAPDTADRGARCAAPSTRSSPEGASARPARRGSGSAALHSIAGTMARGSGTHNLSRASSSAQRTGVIASSASLCSTSARLWWSSSGPGFRYASARTATCASGARDGLRARGCVGTRPVRVRGSSALTASDELFACDSHSAVGSPKGSAK